MKFRKVLLLSGELSGDEFCNRIKAQILSRNHQHQQHRKFLEIKVEHISTSNITSIMGFGWHLIKQIPHILKLRKDIVKKILHDRPDHIVTVDSKGFNFRVLSDLQHHQFPVTHIVAPSSYWAWKKTKKKSIDEHLGMIMDELLLVLPFEKFIFHQNSINSSKLSMEYIGYPGIEDFLDLIQIEEEEEEVDYYCPVMMDTSLLKSNIKPDPATIMNALGSVPFKFPSINKESFYLKLRSLLFPGLSQTNSKILLLLPGSRAQEVKYALPVMLDAIRTFQTKNEYQGFVFCCTPIAKKMIAKTMEKEKDLLKNVILVDSENKEFKRLAFLGSDSALCVSGTVSTECLLAGINNLVVMYDANFITKIFVKSQANIRYATLHNIFSNSELVPEFLFENCTTSNIVRALLTTNNLSSKETIEKWNSHLVRWSKRGLPIRPSRIAAELILKKLYMDPNSISSSSSSSS